MPYFVRTELSQVHNILAKVQFLKKHCFTSKEHRFISKEQRFISKNHRFVSKKNGVLHINKKVGGRFAFTRLKLLLTLPK